MSIRDDPQLIEIIKDEVNVKEVIFLDETPDNLRSMGLEQKLTVKPAVLAPRLGKDFPGVLKAVKAGEWSEEDGIITVNGHILLENEYSYGWEAVDLGPGIAAQPLPSGGWLFLDTNLTPELIAEGLANDVSYHTVAVRKAHGLEMTTDVELKIIGDQEALDAIEAHLDSVKHRTRSTSITLELGEGVLPVGDDESKVTIEITKVLDTEK